MKQIFKDMVENAILDHDPEMFADEYYDIDGTVKVLQMECFGDEGEETLSECVLHKGSGGNSSNFVQYDGEKHCLHFSGSIDVDNFCLDANIDSIELGEWIDICRKREEYLQITEDIINQIDKAESVEDVNLPDHDNYNTDVINDMLEERFQEVE